ncbi:MAG: hypothetical protein PWR24_252 [Desulfonauticus sp.]|jgi:hypothetical protein|nr:MAG: hypothetical protein XD41_0371 [Desulfonauticus sp. 38_4375]MDK2920695.1 hypothetical protein [Desulfonauticus sp.]
MDKWLFFPYLHEEYIDPQLRERGKILNIGFLEPKTQVFTPSNLYFSPKEARAYLNFCLEFGAQFKDIKDMKAYLLQQNSPLEPEGVLSIKSELLARDKSKENTKSLEENRKYHMLLILYYAYEERIMEIINLEKSLDEKLASIRDIMGVEEELNLSKKLFFNDLTGRYELKAELVFPAFKFFAPQAGFIVSDESVFEELKSKGVEWRKEKEENNYFAYSGEYKNSKFVYYKKLKDREEAV